MYTAHSYSDSFPPMGKRIAAFAIDLLILSIPITAVMIWFGVGFGVFEGSPAPGYPEDMSADVYKDATGTGTVYFLYSLIPLFSITYFAVFESSPRQATIGKQLMGIKVVNGKGEDMTLMNALQRATIKFFVSGIFLIGYLMAFFNDKHLALHDKWSNTFVVTK